MGRNRIGRLSRTLRFVRPIQLYYQIYYRIRKKIPISDSSKIAVQKGQLHWTHHISSYNFYNDSNRFSFLNLEKQFDTIDWNYAAYGKLWTYNLNYFDFLQQKLMSKEEGLELINDFCSKSAELKDAYEPYPISLRVINWVKFISKHQIDDHTINAQLYQDLYKLKFQLEYHILANHLFENGFGLLFGAYYFQDEKLYTSALKIIKSELKEQILSDGAHYELTPMYHQIILHRILDSYQLITKNDWKNNELADELKEKVEKMLGWMQEIRFKNGDIPRVNDTTVNIAPAPDTLLKYALVLGIEPSKMKLGASGYRKINKGALELLFDVGQIAPSYQPGHSHADNLQVIMYKNGLPVIVDTGISTYEKNARRQLERSTSSHNTVTVNGENSSEVWSGFRVGRRAQTTVHKDKENRISASHNGYRKLGIAHYRAVLIDSDRIVVHDKMTNKLKNNEFKGHLHFHPDRTIELLENQLFVDGSLFLEFDNSCVVQTESYDYCEGYNKLLSALKVTYTFAEECKLIIRKD